MLQRDLTTHHAYRKAKQHGANIHSTSPSGEIVENVGTPDSTSGFIPTNPPISPHPSLRIHPIPDDSALADYRSFMRGVSEAPDSWLVAPILAVAARLLTPAVWLDFAGYKPITLFQFIAGPAGLRKSTSTNPAERLAARLLPSSAMLMGNASDSALFDSFETEPHRLQIEDEGNTIIRTWSTSHYGREVAGRYLRLYDGQPWGQNFRREAKAHEDGQAERKIERATLSLVIASTFGVSRFDGVDAASGLRRRFGYYVETGPARQIDWPTAFGDDEVEELAEKFRPLLSISGRVGQDSFGPGAWKVWQEIQRENREETSQIEGMTAADEAAGAALNESPSRILKLAVIFQTCRWLKDRTLEPLELNAEVLRIAHAHQKDCLAAGAELDTVGRRAATADIAESILARIRADHGDSTKDGWMVLDKTTLTNKFASHPERPNSLTPARLYSEVIPTLIKTGQARAESSSGKRRTYAFRRED